MAVRTILYKVFIGNKQPRQHAVQYWSAVRRNLGGDIGLKDMIIQEHAGMGVVAALVLTVAAAGFALGPTCWNGANLYNTQASLLLTMCLAASFAFSLYTISGSYEIIAQSLKVQNDRFLEWVLFWKGHVCWEYQGTMLASLLTLAGSMLAMIYLMKGGLHFWIAAGIIGGIILVSSTCMGLLHEHLLQHHLFANSDAAAGPGGHMVTSDAHVGVMIAQAKQQRAAAGLTGDQSPRCVLPPQGPRDCDDSVDLEAGLGQFPGRSWASGMLGSTYLVRPPSHSAQAGGGVAAGACSQLRQPQGSP